MEAPEKVSPRKQEAWRYLGHHATDAIEANAIDLLTAPPAVDRVTLVCRDFTSRCPVTNQPDFAAVTIQYMPRAHLIESKSLKLYLQRFREDGAFCEHLADTIARELSEQVAPEWIEVTVEQSVRGGIITTAHARLLRAAIGTYVGAARYSMDGAGARS
jgi:7-cyano-7-deazaguanine reductase